MNKIFSTLALTYFFMLVLFVSSFSHASAATAPASPASLGYWKTIDDVSNEAKSIVYLSLDQKQQLTGKVVKIFPRKGLDEHKRCTECQGARKNQPVLGMQILWGLSIAQLHPEEWQGGSILDPKNGKIYRCMIKLSKNGDKLNVRGYIGMPLLGRSQTWLRVNGINK